MNQEYLELINYTREAMPDERSPVRSEDKGVQSGSSEGVLENKLLRIQELERYNKMIFAYLQGMSLYSFSQTPY